MPASAQSIIRNAQTDLLDLEGVRWPAPELVRYLNDGQRDIAVRRPDQVAVTRTTALAAGARQALAADVIALIDIPRNDTGKKRAVTKVDQLLIDAVERDWQGRTGVVEIKHFMHDLREPRTFMVYPPAIGAAAELKTVVAVYPADLPVPATSVWTSVTGDIGLSAQWANALHHYVMFRAFSRDAEPANAAAAAAHYGLYIAALGEQLQSTATVAPTT